jgi:uncharacterized membrane protein HdeD (DUF308 family)
MENGGSPKLLFSSRQHRLNASRGINKGGNQKMRTTLNIARYLVRITGVIQIVLGLLFWAGQALSLIPVHMLSGTLLVLSLWVIAALAARAGVDSRFVALAFVWGLVTIALGLTQGDLLPGPAHIVIQILHLLIGLGAIGQAESLARRIEHSRVSVLHA